MNAIASFSHWVGRRQWTVRQQITAGLAVLLVVMAVLVVSANVMLGSVRDTVNRQSQQATPSSQLLLNIDRDAYQAQVALERVVHAGSTVDVDAERADFEENADQTASRFDEFLAIAVGFDGEAELADDVVDLRAAWIESAQATLEAPAEAQPALLAATKEAFSAYRDQLDGLSGLYEEEILRLTDEIQDAQSNLVLGNWVALVVAIVLGALIVRFVGRRIGGAIQTRSGSVQAASATLNTLANGITSRASLTAEQAQSAQHSADEVAATVTQVTSAVEELSSCIAEIAKQAELANNVAGDAVGVADDAHRIIEQLGESSREIGEVVKVINSIAEQTNMLALNATIEAARAGTAGRGFAVVATEVKELAGETARATGEITERIAAIQRDTESAINANRSVNEIIARISELQQSIAVAVEEQSITTSQIAEGASVAARSSQEISVAVADVATQAAQTRAAGEDAGRSADELTQLAAELDGLVAQPA